MQSSVVLALDRSSCVRMARDPCVARVSHMLLSSTLQGYFQLQAFPKEQHHSMCKVRTSPDPLAMAVSPLPLTVSRV